MAIVEFELAKGRESGETIVFTSSGFSFSAAFIKNQKLEQKRSVKILRDETNPYWIGFKFLDEPYAENSVAVINRQGNSGKITSARTVKAGQLYSVSSVLRSLRDAESKIARTFPIRWDLTNRLFYADLRPNFELKIPFEERNSIGANDRGIYRYRNASNEIIYIGKGVIRDRAMTPERQDWQIVSIEYSLCLTDEDSYRWEAFHIEDFERLNGRIPLLNKIKGRDN